MHEQGMSESSSGQNTGSQKICPSSSSYCSGLSESRSRSALSRNRTFHRRLDSGISSLLPSDSFKYITWLEVEQHDIQGSQLRCPRDLGDPYQLANFNRILRRLIRVETLWLVDNSLVDLSAIRLPSCRVLNMNKNYLTSFKQLPKMPQIQHLSLAENYIETLTGLSRLRGAPLESLVLKRNPCEFHQHYRKRVFSCLPNLKMLDGILKLPEDSSPPETSIFSKMCILS
nr:uncharacterized protein LOC106834683 isoform X5 [Equus asinus]